MTQRERLKEHLDSGKSITRLSAFNEIGIFELSARIVELEKGGYNVLKTRETVTNRYDEKVSITRYTKR
jgi:hypothetical protein